MVLLKPLPYKGYKMCFPENKLAFLCHLCASVVRKKWEHPNFEKITAATPKTLLNPLNFVFFAFFAVHSYQAL